MKSYIISNRLITLALLLGVCTVLAYLPALNLGFVNFDDDKYVYDNPHVLTMTSSFLKWAFTTFEVGGNWHPLTWLSLGIDRLLWGTGPMGFHATNIFLHGLNTVFVTILVALLIAAGKQAAPGEGSRISDRGMMVAAVTGILFGFHPIHVESVAWISERKDVLCAFFFLAGMLVYMRYALSRSDGIAMEPFYRGRSSRLYFLTLFLFVLSLLSKPMAVTFPIVLLILDWQPLGRFESRERSFSVILEKLPFFAFSLASSIITITAQTLQTLTKLPLMDRFLNGAHSFNMYLWKMFVPLNLIPYYPYPIDISPQLTKYKYLAALLIAAGIAVSCAVLYRMKRGRSWIAAWGYYLVTLIPVLGLIQVGVQSMADRYAYLPSLGPFLLTGLGLAYIVDKKYKSPSESLTLRYSVLVVLGILTLTLSYLTVRQTSIWKDGLTFWNYVIEKEPGRVDVAYNNRGTIYLDRNQFEEALQDFNTALTINPSFVTCYSNRAQVYIRLRKYTNAMKDLTMALTLSPRYVLGYVYRSMMFNWQGDHEKALADLTAAITIKPDFVLAYFHRGNTNLVIGQYDEAIADFSKALSLDPNSPEGYFLRGKAYMKKKSAQQAEQDFEKACKMGYSEACSESQPLDGRSEEKRKNGNYKFH